MLVPVHTARYQKVRIIIKQKHQRYRQQRCRDIIHQVYPARFMQVFLRKIKHEHTASNGQNIRNKFQNYVYQIHGINYQQFSPI